jgi:hypothetical protein
MLQLYPDRRFKTLSKACRQVCQKTTYESNNSRFREWKHITRSCHVSTAEVDAHFYIQRTKAAILLTLSLLEFVGLIPETWKFTQKLVDNEPHKIIHQLLDKPLQQFLSRRQFILVTM